MTKQIAFIQIGTFSHANHHLATALQKQFPQHELDIIDLRPLVLAQKRLVMCNLAHVVKEYGCDILRGRKSLRRSFFATSYMFQQLSALAASRVSPCKHLFSLQTQSMFDAGCKEVNHFVYTDHTVLAYLRYGGVALAELRSYLFTPGWIELERKLYQRAAMNFSMSTFVAQSLVEDYGCPPHKVARTFAGGNATTSGEPVRAADKMYNQKNILFVGMDWARKGGPVLVEAFKRVAAIHPDATLTIVGCSPKVKLPNCRVIGKVPLAEVRRHYAEATLFCLPTKVEPFGFVFIEAMAQKLPIVATRTGAIPDFVSEGENGHLVNPGDVEQLATVLARLINAPETCRVMGEASRHKVEQSYSWDRVARLMKAHIVEQLYK